MGEGGGWLGRGLDKVEGYRGKGKISMGFTRR